MTDKLSVDLNLLEDTGGQLGLLMGEFKNAAEIAEDGKDAIGSPDVWDAVHGFEDNWSKHREHLLDKMDGVYKMATKGHDGYIEADDKLAKDLLDAMSKDDKQIGNGGGQ